MSEPPAGRPQVMARKCETCVFHPGNRMHLGPGRLTKIIRGNLDAGAALICHKTLSYGEHPEAGQAVCRGFYDAYGEQVAAIQVVNRLGGFREIEPPGEVQR